MRPFLKWPGGKYRMLNALLPHFPRTNTLVEPFVGAGAIFLNIDYEQYYLNDLNHHLIQLYTHLLTQKENFINTARLYFDQKQNNSTQYYGYRAKFNQIDDSIEKSAIFMFLNRHGYNGLCRFNKRGKYNVPFGDHVKTYFPEMEMQHFLNKKNITFSNYSFEDLFKALLKKKNLTNTTIYCDPPYAPLNTTTSFTNYTGHSFSADQQKKLAEFAHNCQKKGAHVLISNHDTPFTRSLYQKASIVALEASRLISCKTDQRKKVKELLAIYTP